MTKQHNEAKEIMVEAAALLASIAHTKGLMQKNLDDYNAIVARYTPAFEANRAMLASDLAADEKTLQFLMKKNKGLLFAAADVVNLESGSLIRNQADHVSIPKTALQACKDNEFIDVIKVVESLDRDAIEKWPDAKLVLIGAERKPRETFEYSLKGNSGTAGKGPAR